MKKTLLAFLCCVALDTTIFAQVGPEMAPKKMTDKELGEYYLQKSKSQKTIGFIMLGGGLLLEIVGAAITSQDIYAENTGAAVMVTVGVFSTLGSIPLFISSARNKGRAEVLLRYENIPLSHVPGVPRKIPAIGISFPLGK